MPHDLPLIATDFNGPIQMTRKHVEAVIYLLSRSCVTGLQCINFLWAGRGSRDSENKTGPSSAQPLIGEPCGRSEERPKQLCE